MNRTSIRAVSWLTTLVLLTACSARIGGSAPDGGGDGPLPDLRPARYTDFPPGPVLDPGGATPVPGNVATLFGPPQNGTATGGPCLLDPEVGSLFPNNWLRLRVSLQPPAGQNLFEIRLHAENQVNDLVVYTSATTWTMPLPMWTALHTHTQDAPITISVRGAAFDGKKLAGPPALGTSGDFTIAPVSADGTIVYWTTSDGTALRGFSIGDETVSDVLRPAQAGASCIGCHSATPDGLYAGMSASSDPNNGDPSQVALRSVNGQATVPPYVSAAAQMLLGRVEQQLPTFSRAHFTTGDRVLLSMFPINNSTEIIWTDLEATSTAQGQGFGVIGRGGDTRMAASANPSHNGRSVVYTSATQVGSGVTQTDGDVTVVPYNNRQGGTSMKVTGASDPAWNEYYPVFSPDDALLAFNRVPTGQSSYNNSAAEVFVVPAGGGTAVRLSANDPPACGGRKSPGITNSWPKWSPASAQVIVQEVQRTFYWLTFSSTRAPAGNPQLYVAAVVVEGGTINTYKALYLWNQPATENNHTPAWDVFNLPIQ